MKKRFTGFSGHVCFVTAALGLFSTNAQFSYGQCTAVNQMEVPEGFMNAGYDGSGNFNAIVFGNYNTGDGGSTAGRLLVGGSFTLNSVGGGYEVGEGDGSLVDKDNLVIQGVLLNSSGGQIKVRGDAKYGSLGGGSALPIHEAGEGTNTTATGLFDYADLKTYYQTLSTTKGNLTALGTVNVTNGVVTLTGNGSVASYVFNVTLVTGEITDINYVNVPVGSEILINVFSTSVTISPAVSSTAMVSTYRDKTLFNFPNAGTIFLSSFTLEGALLAPSANLSASASRVNGSAVIGGNILLANDFDFATGCFTNPLPVVLSSFSANREGMVSNLNWETTSESNARKFIIERSVSAKYWDAIGEVSAKGESKELKYYSFLDLNPLGGNSFYRLKMIDMDASFSYSSIVGVKFSEYNNVSFYPNPVTAELNIKSTEALDLTRIEVIDQSGKSVIIKPMDGKKIDVKGWSPGLYLIKLTTGAGNNSTCKILKN